MTGALEAIQDDIAERRPCLLDLLVGYQISVVGPKKVDMLGWCEAYPDAIRTAKQRREKGEVETFQARFAGRMCIFSIPKRGPMPIEPPSRPAKALPPRIAEREYTKAVIAGRVANV